MRPIRSRSICLFAVFQLLCLHALTTQAFITALPPEIVSRSSHIVNTKTRGNSCVSNILPRTGRGTTNARVSLELAKSRSPRFGGRRQQKRRKKLETKSVLQPSDVKQKKKFRLGQLSLLLLGGIALTQLLFGTTNPSSSSSSTTFYYYESSIVQQNIEINGQVQTSRKERVRTNIPDIVILRPGTDTEEGSVPSLSQQQQQQQQKLKTIDSFDSMLLFDNMLQRFWNDEDY